MNIRLQRELLPALQQHAAILQPILAEFSHLNVSHLNYYYADWHHQTVVFTGTEADWLQYAVELGWLDDLSSRLQPLIHLWVDETDWYEAYQQYRQQQHLEPHFLKTDLCLEGQHGFHLLEVGHEQPLSLYETNSLFDAIGVMKDECRRLQSSYPLPSLPLQQLVVAPQPPVPPITPFFDLSQIEEADPIPLNTIEEKIIKLRLQGYADDEIAQKLQLCLTDVRQLFVSIADKHHYPYIPTWLYQRYLTQLISP
ncbi:MAG: hypothetical protein ISP86_04415 [Shewanellaceae bacterium]|nr:hypothetical protein [Shewanellaceae bacterium]